MNIRSLSDVMVDPNGMQWTISANPEPPNMAIPLFALSPSQSSKIKLDINGSNALSSIKNFGSYKSAEDFWNAVAKIWVDLKDKSAFIQNNGNGSFSVAFYKSGAGLYSSYDDILSSGASYLSSDAYGTQFWKSGKENGIIHNPFSTFKGYGQNLNYKEKEINKWGGLAWERAGEMDLFLYKPDAMGITISANIIGISGLYGSISVGIVGNHFGVWYTRGVGVRMPELSAGVSLFAATYKEKGALTLESYAQGRGDAFNGLVGIEGISLIGSYGRGFDERGKSVWESYSLGPGVYSPFHSLPETLSGNWQSTYSGVIWPR